MRKTKIVCTIGPACDSEETLRAMMLAGMNVARLNFSHGTHAEHQVRIDRIKKLRAELDLPIAIMLDTKGPEYRIGTFENGKIELHSGDTFTFTTEAVTGNAERVSVSYAGLAQVMGMANLEGYRYSKLGALREPSRTWLITDYSGSVDPMAFIYLRSDLNYAERFRPPFRHGNVMNVAFPDGHAEGVRRPEQPSGLDAGWLFASPVNQ